MIINQWRHNFYQLYNDNDIGLINMQFTPIRSRLAMTIVTVLVTCFVFYTGEFSSIAKDGQIY